MSLSISSNLKIYDDVGTHERSADLKYNMLKLHPSKWDKDNASNTIYHNSSHNYILDSIVFFNQNDIIIMATKLVADVNIIMAAAPWS